MLLIQSVAGALDTSEFDNLVGYTVVACTHAAGEMEGADFDKLVKLDNGMIFEFHSYSYFYAYRPDVAVLEKSVDYQGKTVSLYKLVIGDENEVFDVSRVR
jgi:hypothetical protein